MTSRIPVTPSESLTNQAAPQANPRRDRGLHAWVLACFFAWFSDAAFIVGLGWTALHSLDATAAGIVVALAGLTQFVTGFAGGVVADRHDPRTVLRLCAAAALVVIVVGAALWQAGLATATLFGITAAFGVLTGISRPARSAWTRSLVDDVHMPTLVSWTQMASRVAQFSGAPLGAFAVGSGGFGATLGLAALGATSMTLVLWRLTARIALPRTGALSPRAALDGLRYLRDHRDARRLVIGISATNVCVTPLMTIGLAMTATESRWGAPWVGYGEAATAASALVGSALAPRLTAGRPARVSFVLLMSQGVALPLVTSGSKPAYLIGLAVVGVTAGIASVHLSSIYLATIDPAYLGRVGSWVGALDLTLGPLVTPIWTRLAAATSLTVTSAAFGVASLVVGAALAATTWAVGRHPGSRRARGV